MKLREQLYEDEGIPSTFMFQFKWMDKNYWYTPAEDVPNSYWKSYKTSLDQIIQSKDNEVICNMYKPSTHFVGKMPLCHQSILMSHHVASWITDDSAGEIWNRLCITWMENLDYFSWSMWRKFRLGNNYVMTIKTEINTIQPTIWVGLCALTSLLTTKASVNLEHCDRWIKYYFWTTSHYMISCLSYRPEDRLHIPTF